MRKFGFLVAALLVAIVGLVLAPEARAGGRGFGGQVGFNVGFQRAGFGFARGRQFNDFQFYAGRQFAPAYFGRAGFAFQRDFRAPGCYGGASYGVRQAQFLRAPAPYCEPVEAAPLEVEERRVETFRRFVR